MSIPDHFSYKSVIFDLLNSVENFKNIPDNIENELLEKIESYWYQMETEFETKMDASKTWRIDITDWDPPRLWFKIIRHPGARAHLIDFEEDDSYSVKVASNLEEFTTLLESGFEFVSDYEGGLKILRKRK